MFTHSFKHLFKSFKCKTKKDPYNKVLRIKTAMLQMIIDVYLSFPPPPPQKRNKYIFIIASTVDEEMKGHES